jgi:hypothetical protein
MRLSLICTLRGALPFRSSRSRVRVLIVNTAAASRRVSKRSCMVMESFCYSIRLIARLTRAVIDAREATRIRHGLRWMASARSQFYNFAKRLFLAASPALPGPDSWEATMQKVPGFIGFLTCCGTRTLHDLHAGLDPLRHPHGHIRPPSLNRPKKESRAETLLLDWCRPSPDVC